MRSTSGYIFSVWLAVAVIHPAMGQDTLCTYGPRIGIDLARFAYFLADPPEKGAEVFVDAELFPDLYPVFEMGFSSLRDTPGTFEYGSSGIYARFGLDYNLLKGPDRTVHHSITVGFRYGIAPFTQWTENVTIPKGYWGEFIPDRYEGRLTGHWLEGVASLKTEVLPNLFLGWNLRYRILLNPSMDPLVPPRLVPGYGNGFQDRGFGFTYSISYKIPLWRH